MLLEDWLKKNNISALHFAKKIGMAHTTLYRNINGNQRMSPVWAVKIEKATNGEVSRMEALWPEDCLHVSVRDDSVEDTLHFSHVCYKYGEASSYSERVRKKENASV